MIEIPQAYQTQAVKPRGNNVNERLSFLIEWYKKTASIVSSGLYQKSFLETTQTAIPLMESCVDENPDTTKGNVKAQISKLEELMSSDSFFKLCGWDREYSYYFYVELSRVVE